MSTRPPPSTMKEILKKFGDDRSSLFDQFERLSFELQLNRAILGRSLSESTASSHISYHYNAPPPPIKAPKAKRGSNSIGFQKVLKKLLRPFLSSVGRPKKKDEAVHDHCKTSTAATIADGNRYRFPIYSKAFSRSVRVGRI